MSARIERTFAEARKAGRGVFVGYLTAGDPNAAESEQAVRTALAEGVDVLELGVPFSDPTADGPVIQEAGQRALKAGMTLRGCLELVRRVRRDFQQPIILFGYLNPFLRYGYEALARDAAEAGVDGLLVVDLPFEESDELRPALAAQGLCLIPLVAPTTSEDRMGEVLGNARGFVYYIMVKGVTGVRTELPPDAREHLAALRRRTTLPIAAGFGISRADQVKALAGLSDGIVVGSALVTAAREGRLAERVRELREALEGGAGGSGSRH